MIFAFGAYYNMYTTTICNVLKSNTFFPVIVIYYVLFLNSYLFLPINLQNENRVSCGSLANKLSAQSFSSNVVSPFLLRVKLRFKRHCIFPAFIFSLKSLKFRYGTFGTSSLI
jgi:hypothetical protein